MSTMATNLPDGDFKISENHGVKKKKKEYVTTSTLPYQGEMQRVVVVVGNRNKQSHPPLVSTIYTAPQSQLSPLTARCHSLTQRAL